MLSICKTLECGDLSPLFWEIEMTQFTHLWPQVLKKAATSRRTPKVQPAVRYLVA